MKYLVVVKVGIKNLVFFESYVNVIKEKLPKDPDIIHYLITDHESEIIEIKCINPILATDEQLEKIEVLIKQLENRVTLPTKEMEQCGCERKDT